MTRRPVSKAWLVLMLGISSVVVLLVGVVHIDSWLAHARLVESCESYGAHVELRSPEPANPLVVPGSELSSQCVSITGEPIDIP